MLKRRIVQYWTTIKDTCKKHKKTALAILLIIAVAAGGSVGYKLMTATDSGVASSEKKLEQAKVAEEEAISEEKKAEEELEKAKKSGDKEAIEEAEKKVEQAKKKVTSAKKEVASSNKNNSSTKKPSNSGSSSTNKPSKPSKPSSGNSGSSGSGGSTTTQPSKPAHQHNWQPIYKEYTTQIIDPNNPSYIKCNDCGANLGRNGENWMDHADATGHEHGTTRVYNYISHVEKQLVGYKCSCGATK